MNYYHMQLHPDDIQGYTKETILNLLKKGYVGIDIEPEKATKIGCQDTPFNLWTKDDLDKYEKDNEFGKANGKWKSQIETFLKLKKDDIIVVRRGSEFVALTKVVGEYTFNRDTTELWFRHRYPVIILKTFKEFNGQVKIPKPYQTIEISVSGKTFAVIKEIYQDYIDMILNKKEIDLLKSNKNIVLTGAPGTGKTYLAKEIAENLVTPKVNDTFNIDGIDIKEYLKEGEIVKTIENYSFSIISITDNNIKVKPDKAKNEYSVSRKDIIECLKNECYNKSVTESNKGGVGSYMIGIAKRIMIMVVEKYISFVQFHPSYDYTDFVEGLRPKKEKGSRELGFELKNGIFKEFCKKAKDNPEKDFVFIIDEINRAEISKVFGELFFAIDPGYRGEKGKVKTQYANMQTDETFFTDKDDDYFFVPENVYIIATMNDIDRSVESFDFAMRRRFAWKEIAASERVEMWVGNEWKDEAGLRMEALNKAIEGIDGLNSSYHIGPAYFLKLNNYEKPDNPWEKLWDNHLKVLLREYLRGMPKAEDILNDLKKVYDSKSSDKTEK